MEKNTFKHTFFRIYKSTFFSEEVNRRPHGLHISYISKKLMRFKIEREPLIFWQTAWIEQPN
jgi:hypothetical protein